MKFELQERCRKYLAGYKQPKEIYFFATKDIPRSATGKIQRHEVERWISEKRNQLNLKN